MPHRREAVSHMIGSVSVPPTDSTQRDGILVIACWTESGSTLMRVTATVDEVEGRSRAMTTRAEVHGALDAWLDRLGVS